MSLIELERIHHVAILTLNRPEARNALSIEFCNAIVDALEEIDSDAGCRVVVIQGAGKAFCSGADFAAVAGPGGLEFLPAFERMLEAVTRFRLPTIAAIHGAALGGGLQLALTCDFRIAADDAKLGIPSPKIGILVNFENIQCLVLLAGIAVAKEIMLTGRTIMGVQARDNGLVNQAVPSRQLYDQAVTLAAEIAELAPLSVQGAKRGIQLVIDHLAGARDSSPSEVAAYDDAVAKAYASDDLSEGLRAMKEKRSPSFGGE